MTLRVLIFSALYLATLPVHRDHSTERVIQVHALADAIVEHHGDEDPWILAALAVKETMATTTKVGRLKECGAMQVMHWHLRGPGWSCAYLQTPEGSVRAAVQSIKQWRDWPGRPADVDPWWCYASGNSCSGKRATRRLFSWRADLKRLAGAPL